MLPSPLSFNVPGAGAREEERHEPTRLDTANVKTPSDSMLAWWVGTGGPSSPA
jgi:hypothetical protein